MKLVLLLSSTALSAYAVRLDSKNANSILKRSRRDNEGIFEETKQGNYERECAEEICSYEETREVYEDDALAQDAFKKQTAQCNLKLCHSENTVECVNNWGDYTCNCKSGWTGKHCDEDKDECVVNDFCGIGSCANTLGSFQCTCGDFWNGTRCEVDVDECTNEQICGDNGTCVNEQGSYECACSAGWTGTDCTEDVNECDQPDACSGDKICFNELGSFSCMCPGGKLAEEGSDLCTLDFNECDLNPCPVGLTCVNQDNGYHCGCSDMGCEYDVENPSEVEEIDDSTDSTESSGEDSSEITTGSTVTEFQNSDPETTVYAEIMENVISNVNDYADDY